MKLDLFTCLLFGGIMGLVLTTIKPRVSHSAYRWGWAIAVLTVCMLVYFAD